MKMIFLDPNGSGKRKYQKMMEKEYHIKYISIPEIFQNTVLNTQKDKKLIMNNTEYNSLIKDPIIIHLIAKILKKNNCFERFILNNFPKTILQAQEMESKNIKINYIIELKLPNKFIYERNMIMNNTQHHNYQNNNIKNHVSYGKKMNQFNEKQLRIEKNKNLKRVHRKILEYKKIKNVIMNFYKKKIQNKIIKYYPINGTNTNEIIYKKIKKIITSKMH
ncbi:nucleoside monophosphate kinase [Buchnera aphidicola]|uniref:nucleoside monophosphate kinase n=1 Tax=Buchnera aphidicola TaxID=9 RepID=UPI003463CFDA